MTIKASLPKTVAAVAIVVSASAASLALPTPGFAQPAHPRVADIIPESASVQLQARIKAIDTTKRTITLSPRAGNEMTVTAGPAVRLELLKVGDVVDVKYYRSVGFAVSAPQGGNGTPVSDNEMTALVERPVHAPGGIVVSRTRVSGLVVGIDRNAHTVDLVDPSGGGIFTVEVTNPARIAGLAKLKVGDTVTAVISQALAVTVTPSATSTF